MSDTQERQWSTEEQRWLYPKDFTIQRLRAALEAAKRTHHVCVEDCWYSCPKSGECCNDTEPEGICNCGADDHNAKIDEALNHE